MTTTPAPPPPAANPSAQHPPPCTPEPSNAGLTALLLHPVVVAAAVGLIVNDHWAKRHIPSWVTGKASDALGALLLTVVGVALIVVAQRRCGVRRLPTRRLTGVVATAVVVSVGIVKTSSVGAATGGVILGLAAWPLEIAVALLGGQQPTGPSAAHVVVDPLDAVAALAAFVAVAITPPNQGRAHRLRTRYPPPTPRSARR